MSAISLEAAIRTCKVQTGWANRVESDRFLNPNLMMCPVWNGLDTAGRSSCPDSFYTKRGGCNSAVDRIMVENDVSRPQYIEYITLSEEGIKGGNMYSNTMPYQASNARAEGLKSVHQITGQFGNQFGSTTEPPCMGNYDRAMSQQNTQGRQNQAVVESYRAQNTRRRAGMR